MDVLFSIIPGHGHFFPCIPLARSLQEHGHSVRFASAAAYADTIRAQGFEAVPAGLDYTQSSARGAIEDTGEVEDRILHKIFVEGPPASLRSLRTVLSERRPDVMLVDPYDFGGQAAAQLSGVPWGSVVWGLRSESPIGSGLPTSAAGRRRFLAEYRNLRRVQQFRESVGLGEPGLLDDNLYDRALALRMAPPSLDPRSLAVLPTSIRLRPEIHRSGSNDQWLDRLPRDRPIVAVSFGTLFGTTELETTTAAAALAAGARVVVATPREMTLRHDLVHTAPWISMDHLMDVSDVFVHHGGWGSIVAAAASGTPSVVVPLAGDQFLHGARLSSVGAARSTSRETMTVEALSSEIERVLEDPAYTRCAEHLHSEIDAMPPATEVVPVIERLAATGDPVFAAGSARVR